MANDAVTKQMLEQEAQQWLERLAEARPTEVEGSFGLSKSNERKR